MSYEFEETRSDKKTATAGVASLLIGGLGLAIKYYSDQKKQEEQSNLIRDLDAKRSRVNDLERKWFRSEAQNNELRQKKKEISELERILASKKK